MRNKILQVINQTEKLRRDAEHLYSTSFKHAPFKQFQDSVRKEQQALLKAAGTLRSSVQTTGQAIEKLKERTSTEEKSPVAPQQPAPQPQQALFPVASTLTDCSIEGKYTQNDNIYAVTVTTKGCQEKDIEYTIRSSDNNGITSNWISIEITKKTESKKQDVFDREGQKRTAHYQSIGMSRIVKSWTLPEHIDTKNCKKSFKDGVLTLEFPVIKFPVIKKEAPAKVPEKHTEHED
jgi:HSP20 family molecular chaperone IbpA